jgi:hypothetical protein
MALKIVHRILISCAIALGLILIIFAVIKGDQAYLASGVLGAVLSVGGALYLRWFLRKQMK